MLCCICMQDKQESYFSPSQRTRNRRRCNACLNAAQRAARRVKADEKRKELMRLALAPSVLCRDCHVEKPASAFRASSIRCHERPQLPRTQRRCKTCQAAYEKRTRDGRYTREPEKYEARKALQRAYHQVHRERHIELGKEYYRQNIERCDYWRSKSCAKRRGATQFMALEEWETIRRIKQCHWCGVDLHPSFTHMDHVVPLCEGGQHTVENVVAACANCNMKREWERKVVYQAENVMKGDT